MDLREKTTGWSEYSHQETFLPNEEQPTVSVTYNGKQITCSQGQNLRRILIDNGLTPHNHESKYINCKGLGTCGTCAVHILGALNGKMNPIEKIRLSLPPFHSKHKLRLACQINVTSNIEVTKGDGFWGEKDR
jgi:ferredoxin